MASEDTGKESAEIFDRNALWAANWNDDEPEDSTDAGESDIEDNGETGGEDDLDPRVQAALEKKIQELVDQLSSEDTNSPVFKGLQRRLNERDRKIAEVESTNKQLTALLNEVRGKANSAEEKATFGLETLLSSFDDETRKDIESKLSARANKSELDQMKQLLAQLVSGSQPQQQQAGNADYQAQQEAATQKRNAYIDQLKQLATITGVDPEDKRLDFGDADTWSAAEIQSRFQKSLKAIVDGDKEIDGVRQKVKTPATRGGSPGAGRLTGMTPEQLLNEGAMQRLKNPVRRKGGR